MLLSALGTARLSTRPCRPVLKQRIGIAPLGKLTTTKKLNRDCSSLLSYRLAQRARLGRMRHGYAAVPEDQEPPVSTQGSQQQWLVAAGLGILITLVYVLTSQAGGLENLLQEVQELTSEGGLLAPLIFFVAYVIATVLLVPASILTLAAGYIFGPLAGTALVSVSSTTGAAMAFLVSRYLARPWVLKKLEAYPKFEAIDRAVGQQGQRIVLLLRLSPLFPFSLLNYALGLTGVGFWEYVAASWLGMLPGTFAYVYLGGAGKAAVDAAGGSGELGTAKIALYAVGAVATILATRFIAQAATTALDEASATSEDSPADR